MRALGPRTWAILLVAGAWGLGGCTTPEGDPDETPGSMDFSDAIEWLGEPASHPERRPLSPCGSRDLDASAVRTSVPRGISVRITYTSRTRRPCAMFEVPYPMFIDQDGMGQGMVRWGSGHPPQPIDVVVKPGRPAVQDLTWTRPCSRQPIDGVRIRMADDDLSIDGVGVGTLPDCPEAVVDHGNLVTITPLRPESGAPAAWPLVVDASGSDEDGVYVNVGSMGQRYRLDPCPDIWLWPERGASPQGYALNCGGVETVTADGTPYLEADASYTFRVPGDRSTPLRAVALVGEGESRLQVR